MDLIDARSQPPEAAAQAWGHPDAAVPGMAEAEPADEDAVFAAQLDDLARCLEKMGAVVSMLEADLERRAAAWRSLAPQVTSATLADIAGPVPRPKHGRRRAGAARRG